MSLIKRIADLEAKVEDLLEIVLGRPDGDTPSTIDGDEDGDDSVMEEDNETYIIGAYHKLNKKKQCKYFWAGDVRGWREDPAEAEEFDDERSARTAMNTIDPPKAAFKCLALPSI